MGTHRQISLLGIEEQWTNHRHLDVVVSLIILERYWRSYFASRCSFASRDQDQQFHKIVIDLASSCLYDLCCVRHLRSAFECTTYVDILASHRFANLDPLLSSK